MLDALLELGADRRSFTTQIRDAEGPAALERADRERAATGARDRGAVRFVPAAAIVRRLPGDSMEAAQPRTRREEGRAGVVERVPTRVRPRLMALAQEAEMRDIARCPDEADTDRIDVDGLLRRV
jgi:hypothetical protein